jgi:hypothetical protein
LPVDIERWLAHSNNPFAAKVYVRRRAPKEVAVR